MMWTRFEAEFSWLSAAAQLTQNFRNGANFLKVIWPRFPSARESQEMRQSSHKTQSDNLWKSLTSRCSRIADRHFSLQDRLTHPDSLCERDEKIQIPFSQRIHLQERASRLSHVKSQPEIAIVQSPLSLGTSQKYVHKIFSVMAMMDDGSLFCGNPFSSFDPVIE
jgi:hypothetical protein